MRAAVRSLRSFPRSWCSGDCCAARRVQLVRGRDEECPVSTRGGTRLVQLVREGRVGGGGPEVSLHPRRLAPRMPAPAAPQRPWSCDCCRRRYTRPELRPNIPPELRLNIPPELRPNAGLGRNGPRVARRHRGTPAAPYRRTGRAWEAPGVRCAPGGSCPPRHTRCTNEDEWGAGRGALAPDDGGRRFR